MNRVTLALTSFLCFLGFALSVVHEIVAMYDNCGKKSLFGSELPCVNNTEAVKPSKGSIEILELQYVVPIFLWREFAVLRSNY